MTDVEIAQAIADNADRIVAMARTRLRDAEDALRHAEERAERKHALLDALRETAGAA